MPTIESTHDMTNLSTPDTTILGNIWSPAEFEAYQFQSYLEFRTVGRDTKTAAILRLLSNRDVHLYGELIVRGGGVRSFSTFGFTCVDQTQDVASFRSGREAGDEVLRIERDGTLTGVEAVTGEWVVRSRHGNNTAVDRPMALKCSELRLKVTTTGVTQWGRMLYDGSSLRVLDAYDGTEQKRLVIQSNALHLRNPDAVDTFKFQTIGSLEVNAPSGQDAMLNLDSSANAGAKNWRVMSSRTSPYHLILRNQTDGQEVFRFRTVGWVDLRAPNGNSARINLDSTASPSGKEWQIFSDKDSPQGLVFKETSGGGAAFLTPGGSLRLDGNLKMAVVTSNPLNADGDPIGTLVIQDVSASVKRLWGRFATGTGGTSNDWWYTTFPTNPA